MNNQPSTSFLARLAASVGALAGNVRFVGVTYRSKETQELARHTLLVGADYRNVITTSMEELTRMKGTLTDALEIEACDALILSCSQSLLAMDAGVPHPGNTKPDLYETICPGLRIHKQDGTLELCGLSVAKKVLEAGTYKTVNSKPLTIAKNKLNKELPRAKYRTLAVDVGAMESVRIGGSALEVE